MHQINPCFSQSFHFHIGQIGHVHRNQVGCEQVQLIQSFKGATSVIFDGFFNLEQGFMNMHVHGKVEFTAVHGDFFQWRIRYGIRRMRCKGWCHQWIFVQFIDHGHRLAQVFVGRFRPDGGEIEND